MRPQSLDLLAAGQDAFLRSEVSPAGQTTFGGVIRDLKCRALSRGGRPIPRLYAAGETASQYGQGLTIAIVLGRLSGQNAAAEALEK
ncbi:MAG: FAD-binding protein [Mesosutterella sp.]|nr:FAD-binding protein [Mesosutterella sp.]